MADDAQLVFCPYSYIINPVVRGAMEVDIEGAIIILDEAQYVILTPGLFVTSLKSEIKCWEFQQAQTMLNLIFPSIVVKKHH